MLHAGLGTCRVHKIHKGTMYGTRWEPFGVLEDKLIIIPTCQQFHQGDATSVAIESVFSTAGNIISSQRACLLPENANMLIFIMHNNKFYDIFK